MRLSICIATFNRADFIAQTLESVLGGLPPQVEVVVVDGASSDGTQALMEAWARRDARIAYHREAQNLGVDRDFDKAVGYARGEYCWLMSDDDVLVPGAVAAVLRALQDDPQLLVVNAQIRTRDLSGELKDNQLELADDRDFVGGEEEAFFTATGAYLSFIGAVVIRRDAWLARDREPYFGTQFIHVGVIFQRPFAQVRVLARPLVRIRYGNASWSARGFDIWVRKWPRLVWSFERFSDAARKRVTARAPARSAKSLLWFRAIGAFGPQELSQMRQAGEPHHALAGAIAALPARVANAGVALYMYVRRHADARVMLYDLLRAKCASGTARWVARRFRFPETER